MDAIALLADTWNDDLDPEVSAQLVQASAQDSLSFGKEKGKGIGEVKAKGKGKGQISCSTVTSVIGGSSELKAKTKCRACGRKGPWANDRECARSSSCSSSTQKSDMYSSYGDTTTTYQPRESGWSVFRLSLIHI